MTIDQRLAKQRAYRSYQYASRLVMDRERYMDDFKLRAKLYGKEWRDMIWAKCKEISNGNTT